MFAVNGILFNHESPRRGETFVTRKITRAVARIKAGLQDKLYLGNLEATRLGLRAGLRRGHVADAAAGRARRLRARDRQRTRSGSSCEAAFAHAGLDWREARRDRPAYYRPTEVDCLLGDPTKAKRCSAGRPTTHWEELARIMVEADVQLVDDQLAGRQVRVDR